MKKILSLLVIFSILCAGVVRADENMQEIFPGWKFSENASIIDDGTGNHIVKLDGNDAEIRYELGKTNTPYMRMNVIANVEDNIIAPDGSVNVVDDNIFLDFGTNNYRIGYLAKNNMVTVERLDDDTYPDMGPGRVWVKIIGTKDVWVDNHTYLYAKCRSNRVIYIDDIDIKSGSNTAYETFAFDFENLYSYTGNPYAVKGLSANGDGENVVLTWRNPDKAVTSFKLYEDGIDITGDVSFTKTASAYNKIVYPVPFGGVKKYTLVTVTEGVESSQTVIGDRAEKLAKGGKYTADGTPLGGWSMDIQNGKTPMYGGVSFDSYNTLDGDYSLRVNTGIENNDGSALNEAWNGGKFTLYAETKGLTSGKNYKFTYNVKTLNARGLHSLYGDNLGTENISTAGVVSKDWKECEYVFTATDGGKLQLVFDGSGDSFWLDGLTLYECNSNGDVTGTENLLVNSSFDNEIEWPAYEFVTSGLFKGTSQVSNLSSGTYMVKAVIQNNKVEDGIQAQVAALLKKDGVLIKSAASEVTNVGIGETAVGFNFDIPDTSDGEYELYIFTWDSLKGMKILMPVKKIVSK